MFPGFQGFDHQIGMCIVTGENSNRVDVRVVDDFIVVGYGLLETELFTGMLGMQSTRRGDANQLNITGFLDRGE